MSLYISHPDIPPMRVGVYPRRRRKQPELPLFWKSTETAPATNRITPNPDACYADFFTSEPMQKTA
ncbi:hypothetical protein EDF46_3431 [Frondihabitans sp. PhB188]|uniref:hypothetical protein n=1 Tax=Frondihabitans sp. PhB188 TaxID=2485200 RepID=UPI000F97D3EC|nr:hypothetical protein [Frondihabitans sp. PhB188]ROQ30919.1 hypothetical protein EDF46_3431 [Frondihabitans sp. PhB188]